jgi:hypothetical protein
MSCDTRRRRLWRTIGLDSTAMEDIFRKAQKEAQGRDITSEEKEVWDALLNIEDNGTGYSKSRKEESPK